MSPILTVSGNELVDANRSAALLWGTGQSGGGITDGRTPPAGTGIYEAATNLFRHGQCDATTDITTLFCTVATDATVPAPFSPQSIKAVSSGLAQLMFQSAAGQALPAGSVAKTSTYFKGVAGQSYNARTRVINTDASTTDGGALAFIATGSWQLVVTDVALIAAGKAGDIITLRLIQGNTRSGEVFWAAHAMIQSGTRASAPYIPTSGGATASRGACRVQGPASLLDETQGWFAARIQPVFAVNYTNLAYLMSFGDSTSNYLGLEFDGAAARFKMFRVASGVGSPAIAGVNNFVVGATLTLIGAWTATQVKISINGAAFVAVANTNIPVVAASTFDIGRSLSAAQWLNGNMSWAAMGLGLLTNADAAAIAALASSSPSFAAFSPKVVWPAVSSSYQIPPLNTIPPVAA